MRSMRILMFVLAALMVVPTTAAAKHKAAKPPAPSPGCPTVVIASAGEPAKSVVRVQTHTQKEYREYAVAVFKRDRIRWRAIRKIVRMERCQHSPKARLNTEHLRKRLIRERRARQEKRRQASIYGGLKGVLDAIAACESGGNPRAVSASGTYRGLFQFDYGTWASVGGSGDPAAASVGEQYMRAAMLYARSGPGPWPVCGR